MRKPWQIWAIFMLILAIVIPAMGWLTWQINEADRAREEDRVQTELARQEAELQERISSALYRMDWWATPLVAQEAARPYYLYEPFYRVSAASNVRPSIKLPWASGSKLSAGASKDKKTKIKPDTLESEIQQPSPLLYETSEFVVMHFQVSADGLVTSPQRPIGAACYRAMACGVPEATMFGNDANLLAASEFCKYDEIVNLCPDLPTGSTTPKNSEQKQQLAGKAGSNIQAGAVPGSGDITFQTVYRDPQFNRYSNVLPDKSKVELQKFAQSIMLMKGPTPQVKGGRGNKADQQIDRNASRGNQDYLQRAQTAEKNARSQWAQAQLNTFAKPVDDGLIREGVMRPLWLGERLVLARRVEGAGKKLVQCCWLDWDLIKKKLQSEVADILPEVDFEPVKDVNNIKFGRAMATLPVHLVVDSQKLLSTLALDSPTVIGSGPSGLKISLLLAWIGLALSALAAALLLRGVMQLSERRAAFVSAVTHELRTPLTTFRMYAEMLAEKMVPAEKQHQYAETMKVEADRLSQLVENVLQFARLERGSGEGRVESVSVTDLFSRFEDRLLQRAEKSNMELEIELGEAAKNVCKTDAAKVEQIVFNLVDNACKYAGESEDKRISVTTSTASNYTRICVQDHGPGVSQKFKRLMFKPFCKSDQEAADTASGVGLGLALCQKMAKSIGGKLYLSDCDQGARFVFELPNE